MRILFVTNRYPTPQTPGDSPVIAQQRHALEQMGHQVDLFFINSAKSKRAYLTDIPRMFETVHLKQHYDLVHAHYGSYCAWLARMQWRSPVVVTFRGSDVLTERERPISQRVAKYIDGAIVMTQEMQQKLGRPDARVIPYGIDTDLFRPQPQSEARRALGLPLDAPLVLFPYDPNRPEKRYDLIKPAMTLVQMHLPDAQLLAVHGQPHRTVAAYMNACDALVLASETEGAPVAIREALACNLPIVSVNVGDVAGLIQNVAGSTIVRRDVGDIARKLLATLQSRQRLNSRALAESFSITKSAEAVLDLYNTLVHQPVGQRRVTGVRL